MINNYYFYISVKSGRYSRPFFVNKASSNYIRLAMIKDTFFSFSAKIEDKITFKVYAVPKQPGSIQSKSHKYKILKFDIKVSESENMVTYLFRDQRFPEITFYQHIKEDDTMFISNPVLIIKTEFLESLIK